MGHCVKLGNDILC